MDEVFRERNGILLVATRERPSEFRGLVQALVDCGSNPPAAIMYDGCELYWPYDWDDWPGNWTLHQSATQRELVASINELFWLHPDRDFYVLAADHARPRTPGWFEKLGAAAGDWGIAYSRDGAHDGRWPNGDRHLTGGVAIGGKLARAMGWLFYPQMIHDSVDRVLEDIANALDLWRWCPDVLVESERLHDPDRATRTYHGIPYSEADFLARQIWARCARQPTIERIRAALGEDLRVDGL